MAVEEGREILGFRRIFGICCDEFIQFRLAKALQGFFYDWEEPFILGVIYSDGEVRCISRDLFEYQQVFGIIIKNLMCHIGVEESCILLLVQYSLRAFLYRIIISYGLGRKDSLNILQCHIGIL